MDQFPLSRRAALSLYTATAAAPQVLSAQDGPYDSSLMARHDSSVDQLLKLQITDPAHRRAGGYSDEFGLYSPGAGSGMLETFMAAYLAPQSKYHKDPALVDRMRLCVRYLQSTTTPEGNVDNPVTNFNSPPDTAFVIHGVANAARLAQLARQTELLGMIEPWLRKAGMAVARGGVHTPNHRWVVCEALAQVNEIFPDPAYPRRIDQWLAEGIDFNEDGQYNERSTTVYNPITDKALLVTALKHKQPQLLDYVRKNLNGMLYLLHADGEVVTDISIRQDRYQPGTMGRYWLPLRYLAIRDGNGHYATLAQRYEASHSSLSAYMLYPELRKPLPPMKPLPDNYHKDFTQTGCARFRRGPVSATLMLNGASRFFSFRRGTAVVEAVRFSSAFFGKGQFAKYSWKKEGAGYRLEQSLDGPYYQPITPSRVIASDEYGATRRERSRSEVCSMKYSVLVREQGGGFAIDIEAEGTNEVPLAVEVCLRSGGKLENCAPAPRVRDGWLLKQGDAVYRHEGDAVRFGPGRFEHSYTQVRGAEPRIAGTSVYLTGFTPFRHTLLIR